MVPDFACFLDNGAPLMTTSYSICNPIKFYTIPKFLNHCSQTKNLKWIQVFHAHLITTGLFSLTPLLQTELIHSYATCLQQNPFKTLTHLFKCLNPNNPIPFNSIISQFSQNGLHYFALHSLCFMHSSSVCIDSYALCSSITSCTYVKDAEFGRKIHAFVGKSGWLSSVFVGSSLIDLYAKSLYIHDAELLFEEIPVKNIVCVNALLSGYAEAKMWCEGLGLVRRMHKLDMVCDNFTFSAALRACVGLSAIEFGRQVHGCVIRKVLDLGGDVFLQSLLIEMYGKCGLVEKARRVFDMPGFERGCERKIDVVLWTSMLGAYGRNGNFEEVIGLFREMLMEGIRPDGVAFLTVISACDHTGQVNLGIEFFESIALNFGLERSPEHYSCLVDLLCRAGELDKAWKLVNEMPHKENVNHSVSLWGSLLSACYESGNVELGKLAAQRALELEPHNVGIYLLLSNIYAKSGMWNEIEQLRELMKGRGLKKDIGRSWVDTTN